MGIWIAREKCGCLTAASIDEQNKDDLAHDIGEWMLRGDIVEHLDIERIEIIKCPLHKKPVSV